MSGKGSAINVAKSECLVCGDFANGKNFGVYSCESCKAFFRRNANKTFSCNFSENCQIDKLTRKFCQKCRQRKCLAVGMKRELTKTDAATPMTAVKTAPKRKLSRDRPEARIEPRSRAAHHSQNYEAGEMDTIITHSNRTSASGNEEARLSQEKRSESKLPNRTQMDSPPITSQDFEQKAFGDNIKKDTEETRGLSLRCLINAAIETEFQAADSPARPTLNDREKARINELYIAARSLDEPFKDEEEIVLSAFQLDPNLVSVINLTNLAIKRIILMTKQLSSFSNLCQEDQVVLVKGGCLELMLLRSVLTFNSEKKTWQLPDRMGKELSMDVLKEASMHGVNLYEEYQRFASSFPAGYRKDETVMLLMSAIALFTTDRNNLQHQSVVRLEQDSYYYLLKRYLETKFTGCRAREAYLDLLGKLLQLRQLNERHLQLFMEMDPREIEPLLREIFDLNPGNNMPAFFLP